MIRAARAEDAAAMRDIEAAAGEAFRAIGMAAVADDPPPSLDVLAGYQRDGRAWVATGPGGGVVAYLLLDVVGTCAHIEQVSVHPGHAGRGLGRRLIDEAARWAAARGLTALTLTTFEDVPWNAPYYARLGFRPLPEEEWPEGLRPIVDSERAHGLHAWPRVVMRRDLPKRQAR